MQFKTLNNQFSDVAILDATYLPKSLHIAPGKYEITILPNENYQVVPKNPLVDTKQNERNIERVNDFLVSLIHAAHGYTDCEMPSSKFSKLISSLSCNGVKVEDFNIKPRLKMSIKI